MPSWQSIALNKVLYRTLRNRLESCVDAVEMRQVVDGLDRLGSFFTVPQGMHQTRMAVAGVTCDWVDMPESEPDRVILFFHGGGFCFKSPKIHGGLLARLCRLAEARGLMVDYRLAPEHPFPAAVDDCFAVYRWLLDKGVDPETIVLAGDSAGGNLVLTTMLQAREAGLPMPAGGVMMSPSVDMGLSGESATRKYMRDPFFDLYSLLLMRNSYMNGTPPFDPLISPIYADLTGLSPLMIHVGEEEILMDDSTRLAAKAQSAGVDVMLKTWPGMPHVFPIFNLIPESRTAITEMAAFILQRTSYHEPVQQFSLKSGPQPGTADTAT